MGSADITAVKNAAFNSKKNVRRWNVTIMFFGCMEVQL
jgi:hypothetical protein